MSSEYYLKLFFVQNKSCISSRNRMYFHNLSALQVLLEYLYIIENHLHQKDKIMENVVLHIFYPPTCVINT